MHSWTSVSRSDPARGCSQITSFGTLFSTTQPTGNPTHIGGNALVAMVYGRSRIVIDRGLQSDPSADYVSMRSRSLDVASTHRFTVLRSIVSAANRL
jgi:hypothetical protein